MKKTVLIFIFLAFATSSFANNPFTSKEPIKTNKAPTITTFKKITVWQYKLNQKLSFLMKELKEKKNKKIHFFIIFILFSFLYGFVHSLMPGHGKFVVSSYMASGKKNIKDATLFVLTISFIHISFSVLIILFLNIILKTAIMMPLDNIRNIAQIVSYFLIMLIGLYLFVKNIIKYFKKDEEKKKIANKNIPLFYTALSIGLIPCTGVVLVMLFAISIDYIRLGLLSAFFQGAGMALSLFFFSIVAIFGKKLIVKKSSTFINISHLIETVASFMILFVGLTLLIATINRI